jgi:hypothetical protein
MKNSGNAHKPPLSPYLRGDVYGQDARLKWGMFDGKPLLWGLLKKRNSVFKVRKRVFPDSPLKLRGAKGVMKRKPLILE